MRFSWRPGTENIADYWTKHHPIVMNSKKTMIKKKVTFSCGVTWPTVLPTVVSVVHPVVTKPRECVLASKFSLPSIRLFNLRYLTLLYALKYVRGSFPPREFRDTTVVRASICHIAITSSRPAPQIFAGGRSVHRSC